MRRLAVVAPCLVALAILGACSLDLDGYAGPAVTMVGDASDAMLTRDATNTSDASVEASVDASGPFCASLSPAPMFCDDFERTSPQGGWDNLGAAAGAKVTIGPAPGGGGELLVTLPAFTGMTANGSANKSFNQLSSDVVYAFDLLVDAPPAQGSLQIMSIFFEVNGDDKRQGTVWLNAGTDGFAFDQQTFPTSDEHQFAQDPIPASVLAYGTRRRVVFHLSLGAPPHAKVTADGVTAYDDTLYPYFDKSTTYFTAGIHYADPPSGPLTVHVDNVTIDVH